MLDPIRLILALVLTVVLSGLFPSLLTKRPDPEIYIFGLLGVCVYQILGVISGFPNFGQATGVQMIIVKGLEIKLAENLIHGEERENAHWKWVTDQTEYSRFKEALELLQVLVLSVKAKINMNQLSPETNYAAYLIFKTTSESEGLHTWQEASISVDKDQPRKDVCLKPRVANPRNKCNVFPVKRPDGWMALELGQFYCDGGAGEVVVCIEETDDTKKKKGLIVAGIELRPI